MKNDIAGKRFGRLVAVEPVSIQISARPRTYWKCICDCGTEKAIPRDALLSSKVPTSSCGCLQRELFGNANRTHGGSDTDLYRIWCNIKDRCNNPDNKAFRNYGARGINLCAEWSESFPAFVNSMGPRPSKLHSIDRIYNDKGYSPENCRWATKQEQGRNRRGLISTPDTTSLKEAAERAGIVYGTVHARVFRHGWTIEDALTIPAKVGQKIRHRSALSQGSQP